MSFRKRLAPVGPKAFMCIFRKGIFTYDMISCVLGALLFKDRYFPNYEMHKEFQILRSTEVIFP